MNKHSWEYSADKQVRYCTNCKLTEYWNEDTQDWEWLSTEEFMNCLTACECSKDDYIRP